MPASLQNRPGSRSTPQDGRGRGPAREQVRRWFQTLPLHALCWQLAAQTWTAVEATAKLLQSRGEAGCPRAQPSLSNPKGGDRPPRERSWARLCATVCAAAVTPPDKNFSQLSLSSTQTELAPSDWFLAVPPTVRHDPCLGM